jgi:hypothetical protein
MNFSSKKVVRQLKERIYLLFVVIIAVKLTMNYRSHHLSTVLCTRKITAYYRFLTRLRPLLPLTLTIVKTFICEWTMPLVLQNINRSVLKSVGFETIQIQIQTAFLLSSQKSFNRTLIFTPKTRVPFFRFSVFGD